MEGRASKWTGIENVIGDPLQVRFENSPKKGTIVHSSSKDLEIITHFIYLTGQEKMIRSSSKYDIFAVFIKFRMIFLLLVVRYFNGIDNNSRGRNYVICSSSR